MINFFARPSYVGNRFHRWSPIIQTQRLSSRIRGEEMAAFLKDEARLNPEKTSKGDINIYVKPENIDIVGEGEYVDYLDGGHFDEKLSKRPDIKIIAVSQNSLEHLQKQFPNNKIFLIPHHHINFDRLLRTKTTIDTFGYIGSYSPHAEKVYRGIQKELANIGINFIIKFDYKTREDAVEFYKNVDVLVVGGWEWGDPKPHKIPTKLINAFSFGIPTIAYPLAGYKEIAGLYYPVQNMSQLLRAARMFKESDYYEEWSEGLSIMAEQYHIEESAKLYRLLK